MKARIAWILAGVAAGLLLARVLAHYEVRNLPDGSPLLLNTWTGRTWIMGQGQWVEYLRSP
jgi:hypothetical protein